MNEAALQFSLNESNDEADRRAILVALLTTSLKNAPIGEAWAFALKPFERATLEAATRAFSGNQVQMAVFLGINRNTLRKRLIEHGLITVQRQHA